MPKPSQWFKKCNVALSSRLRCCGRARQVVHSGILALQLRSGPLHLHSLQQQQLSLSFQLATPVQALRAYNCSTFSARSTPEANGGCAARALHPGCTLSPVCAHAYFPSSPYKPVAPCLIREPSVMRLLHWGPWSSLSPKMGHTLYKRWGRTGQLAKSKCWSRCSGGPFAAGASQA